MTARAQKPAFLIKDCALVALASGRKAQLLQEFRQQLAQVEAASVYHHFWGGLLQARFEAREYNNDFAAWVRHGMHDGVLAERLAALDPTEYHDLETLRQLILDLIDTRLEEAEYLSWARATQSFEFVRSQIVVFNTQHRLRHPRELAAALPSLSTTSVFYHFVDARRRTESGCDDFSNWLRGFGETYSELTASLATIDPYFGSLGELRHHLHDAFAAFFDEHDHGPA